jgi:hypothetical protein
MRRRKEAVPFEKKKIMLSLAALEKEAEFGAT